MFDRIKNFVSLGGIVAAALCLGFPFAWNGLLPQLAGEVVTVQLTRTRAADVIEIAEDSTFARPIDMKSDKGEQRLAYGVAVRRSGAYSLYGISANRHAQPLELWINGRAVSAHAFYQKTGVMREGFERHLIVRNVPLHAGENSVVIIGPRAMYRTMLLELHREAPLGWARYLALVAAAAIALCVRHFLVTRIRLTPEWSLAFAVLFFAAGLALLPVFLLVASDGQLVPLGYKDPVKTGRLERLETRMKTEEHRRVVEEKYNVFVMGDSTHFWSLPPDHHLVPAIQRVMAQDSRDDVEVYGLAGGALNAFDFYLLLNRIVEEEPDLVVVPLSLRSFSDRWLENQGYQFHGMDHYVGASEFFRARNLSVAGRELSTVGWMLRKIDAAWWNGKGEHLLRGVRSFFQAEKERIEREVLRTVFATWEPVPLEAQLEGIVQKVGWNTHISSDHQLFEAFRLLNDLAARHRIELLYYTEQVNVTAQRAMGNDVRVVENFETVERKISGGPGVHYLMLSDRNPPEMFSDDVDHLKPDSIEALAKTLAREIRSIRKAREEKSSAAGEQTGP